MDNPGWTLDIDLAETSLADSNFLKIFSDRSEQDWMHCEVVDSVFRANCGPLNLAEAIGAFLDWADRQSL